MRKPLTISVVIPLYNKQNNIAHTLESVFRQQRLPEEIIIIDDGSTDNSVDVVSSFIDENKNMPLAMDGIRIVHQRNQGVSAARNLGIKVANNRYIAFLDADDSWLPQYLSQIEELYELNVSCEVLATAYQYCIGSKGYRQALYRHPNNQNNYFSMVSEGDLPFNASSVCISKSLLKKLEGFPVGEHMGEDQELWQRAVLMSEVAYSPLQLSVYHVADNNRACVINPAKSECAFSSQLRMIAQRLVHKSELRDRVLLCSATHLRHLAKQYIRSGQYGQAKQFLQASCHQRANLKSQLLYIAMHLVCLVKSSALSIKNTYSALLKLTLPCNTLARERLSILRYRKRLRRPS